MIKQGKDIRNNLPSLAKTQEMIFDRTFFLSDSKRVKKTLAAIYDKAARGFRKGTVDPNEIIAYTSRKMGISASDDSETYTLMLMVIGAMSKFLLSQLTRERDRLFLYFHQLQDDERRLPGFKPFNRKWSRPAPPIRQQKHERDIRHDMMNFFRHADFPSRKEEPNPENPMFPTFHEVITTMSTRNFKYLGANSQLVFRAEQLHDYLRNEFEESGTVADFATVKNENNLVLSRDPYTYAIDWYTWHTTADLQKKIACEMKPVMEPIVKSA